MWPNDELMKRKVEIVTELSHNYKNAQKLNQIPTKYQTPYSGSGHLDAD